MVRLICPDYIIVGGRDENISLQARGNCLIEMAVRRIGSEAGGGKVSAPALLTVRGFIAAARADGTIVGPESLARPGDRIRVFGTGFDLNAEVSVTVGGVAASVRGTSRLGSGRLRQFFRCSPATATTGLDRDSRSSTH